MQQTDESRASVMAVVKKDGRDGHAGEEYYQISSADGTISMSARRHALALQPSVACSAADASAAEGAAAHLVGALAVGDAVLAYSARSQRYAAATVTSVGEDGSYGAKVGGAWSRCDHT